MYNLIGKSVKVKNLKFALVYWMKLQLNDNGYTKDQLPKRDLSLPLTSASMKLRALTPYLVNSHPRKQSVKRICPTTLTR